MVGVGQLLPLRLLGCSTSFLPHSSFPILRRAFPFKLKYFSLPPVSRPFSSLPNRASLRVAAADGGRGRSLVDDEAELSDWVSDLKPDFFQNEFEKGSDVEEDMNAGRRRFEVGVDSKRRRGSESGGRDASSFTQSKRISKFMSDSDLSDDKDDEDEFSSGRRQRGRGTGTLGRSSSSVTRRGGNDFKSDRQAMPRDSGRSPVPSLRREQRGLGGRQGINNRRKAAVGLSEDEEEDESHGNAIGRLSGRRSVERDHRKGAHMVKQGNKVAAVDAVDRRKAAFQISEEDEDEDDDDDIFEVESESETEDDSISTDEDGKKVIGISRSFNRVEDESVAKTTSGSTDVKNASYLSETRFDQCSLSPLSLKGLKAAGYERMTLVQEETLPIILKGKDVLAKARTGTGKTVAFLLPAIEIVLRQTPIDRDNRRPPIYVLIICPTRELANQASMEANTLLKFHPNIGVQFVTGGTRLALEQKRMQANPCQILVATPGRLRDHTENTPGFASRLMGVKVLVLDEADHLLDMGFRKDIEKIISAVPKQRQTLLFSATVPEEVRQVCHIALRRDHEFINTVEEGSEETHSQVDQMLMVTPLGMHFPLLYHILQEHIADDVDYKVLVFCTTAMVTRLVAQILSELKMNVREIHSRKPQSYRTRVSDEFRKSKGLILVTSDVSARGVDYPDVTLVIQVGVPSDREQYIHRLGRTGRKGKEGQGILMLAPWEDYFVSTVKDLPISKASLPQIDPDTRKKVERALAHVEMKNKEAAYQAWLGYYNSNKKVGRDKTKLVELANEFSRSMGLDNPPAVAKVVLGKMGLRNVPGLRSK